MSKTEYLTAICAFSYFGPRRVKLLLSYFGNAEDVWKADKKELEKLGIQPNKVKEFFDFREKFDIQKYFEKLKKLEINVVTTFDKNYPKNLLAIDDAPVVLYVKGKILPGDENAVAIVGTRMMTGYGREATKIIANELAGYGVTVVSGLALGVDAEAQRSVLEAGGRTIAVLASGLDIITPLTNKTLADKILKGNGAVVSEYPLGHLPFKSDFAVRNRLISGLSKGVVVIEGRMKSGTFYTVDAAAIQGRPVFAVPGPINSLASEGPNYLIQNGAKMVLSAKDIMEELSIEVRVDTQKVDKIMPGNKNEAKLVQILEVEALHLDEVVRISGLPVSEVSARLTLMEVKGLVKNLGGSIYRKV